MVFCVILYEALASAASSVTKHKQNFDEMIQGMTGIVSSLDGVWQGVAKTEFETAFEQLKPTLTKFSDLLGRYAEELNKHVTRTQETESAGTQSINQSLSF